MAVIKGNLSVKGIQKMRKELAKYKSSFQYKTKLYVERLIEEGVEVTQAKVRESPLGKYVAISTDISEEKAGCKGIIIATGEVQYSDEYAPFSTILAIEFGAGISYNPNPNPNADELGFGVGTFPGQSHAEEDGWYFWDDAKQMWIYSKGVKATMPMYETQKYIVDNFKRIAKEVFNDK